jgi:hypothetical protein
VQLTCTYGTRICCGGAAAFTTADQAFVCSPEGPFQRQVVDCPACPDAATDASNDGGTGHDGAFTF